MIRARAEAAKSIKGVTGRRGKKKARALAELGQED